jgi:hypothetical protein
VEVPVVHGRGGKCFVPRRPVAFIICIPGDQRLPEGRAGSRHELGVPRPGADGLVVETESPVI